MIASEFQTRTSSNWLFSNYRTHCVAAVLVTVLYASSLSAATMTWTNEAGGNFQTAGNWNPNTVPSTNDTAIFDLIGPYTVTWSASVTNYDFAVKQGSVTWDLNGHTYNFNGSNHIYFGQTGVLDMTITNGTVAPVYIAVNWLFMECDYLTTLRIKDAALGWNYLTIGNGGVSSSRLVFDGASATGSPIGGGYSRIGANGKGTLVVTNGASVSLNGLAMPVWAGSGRLEVSGTNSVCNISRSQNIGTDVDTDPPCVIHISDGGIVENTWANTYYGVVWLGAYSRVELDGGSLLLPSGTYDLEFNGGILEGHGWTRGKIENNAAQIIVGGSNDVGVISHTGALYNYDPDTPATTGTIDIEIAGPGTSEYDQLEISDVLYAGGTLKISLINGYTPGNTTFDIFDFLSADGTFATVNLDDALGASAWDLTQLYVTGEITFIPPPTGTLIYIW